MTRSINFAAGPATLPTEVLERAKAELLDYQHTGMSIMEMSHRGSEFREVLTKAESDFRSLLAISEDLCSFLARRSHCSVCCCALEFSKRA